MGVHLNLCRDNGDRHLGAVTVSRKLKMMRRDIRLVNAQTCASPSDRLQQRIQLLRREAPFAHAIPAHQTNAARCLLVGSDSAAVNTASRPRLAPFAVAKNLA